MNLRVSGTQSFAYLCSDSQRVQSIELSSACRVPFPKMVGEAPRLPACVTHDAIPGYLSDTKRVFWDAGAEIGNSQPRGELETRKGDSPRHLAP
jgi:hypothetical protein